MLVRLLPGALALTLPCLLGWATEPAAAGEEPVSAAPAESSDEGSAKEAEADAPTDDARAADDAPEEDDAEPEPEGDAAEPEPEGDAAEPEPEPAESESESESESEPEPEPARTEPEPTPAEEADAPSPAAPILATEAPRPVVGPPSSGRNDDIVSKALLGGGIASLTLTAGLVGTSAWAWTESNRAERASKNLTGDEQANAQDRRDQMRTIGLITTGAAALYGTTGVVLLLLRARDRKPPPRTVLAPSPGGLSVVGRF